MPKLRGLVVDDAVVMRRLVSAVLESDPGLEVAGIAANGRIALQKLTQVNPVWRPCAKFAVLTRGFP
jgi:two-component system chemotaxis response regulator CheB